MKKAFLLISCLILAKEKSLSQSITIEPTPANGAMVNVQNKMNQGFPPSGGTNHAITIPVVTVLPAVAQSGMMVFNAITGKLQYHNGTTWVAPEVIPSGTVLFSETKTNIALQNAGYSLKGITTSSFNQLSTGSYGWVRQLNALNAPSAREGHVGVWTGSGMFIWGGYETLSSSYVGNGKLYNVNTDSWTPISSTNAPTARGYHATSIWTGTDILVWGGISSGGLVNDGAIYSPNTNTWSTMASVNAPSARRRFSPVWTGDKMMIWGGENYNYETIGDGKLYNPSLNAWSSISTVNAPSPREWHSCVWTGSNVIVWGGANNYLDNTYASGGIYNPFNNLWFQMSNAPTGLFGHTAVWTGAKMIVFGGGIGPYSNACYIYTPQTDTWATANSVNKPSPRGYHTAIWTGSKMIIFGGIGNGNTVLNDGGIYDPVTDTWSNDPITLGGFSYAKHTAVWTEEDMVIFGLSPGHLMKKDVQSPTPKALYLYQKN
ncbi:Kelch repeat-containing protein [Runella aurantiaca]|uniref:Galactose oxidase n=1 Tax=Runella aurantiaca TaxID=2282308 RepID=A0A369I8N0_9BACT|nr:kelch repeat-containing protein [Runella aurantiaca]RDB05958.1 hypothetical protein DVG78_11160 [Runella aurantiaca]